MDTNAEMVYSTLHGRTCRTCEQPIDACTCNTQKSTQHTRDGIVRVSRETKGRKGKGVTVVSGIPLPTDGLLALAKELKQHLGSGGSVKDGSIEIQGEHREQIALTLKKKGYTVKIAGG